MNEPFGLPDCSSTQWNYCGMNNNNAQEQGCFGVLGFFNLVLGHCLTNFCLVHHVLTIIVGQMAEHDISLLY